MLCVAASLDHLSLHVWDITPAYIQSSTSLEQDVLIKAAEEMGIPLSSGLKVVKSPYDIPETGLYCNLT